MASTRAWSLLAVLSILLASAAVSSAHVSGATSNASRSNTYEIPTLPKVQACKDRCMQKRCTGNRMWIKLCEPLCSFGCYGGHTPPQTGLSGGKDSGGSRKSTPGKKENLQPIPPPPNSDLKKLQPVPHFQNSDPGNQQPIPAVTQNSY